MRLRHPRQPIAKRTNQGNKMPKTLISSKPVENREARNDGSKIIYVSENFYDTIQGEGVTAGVPSAFLRTMGCTLRCGFCDTTSVWRYGNPYSVNELLDLWKTSGLLDKLYQGQHLVLTGGSPLKQQEGLAELLRKINGESSIYVEVENEAVLMPNLDFERYVNQWNNSPKLFNSLVAKPERYKPEVLQYMNNLGNSWFKFVIKDIEEDWKEIETDFVNPGYISKEKIILMPEGDSQEKLKREYQKLFGLCCEQGVRFTDRLQITIFDKATGV